jgi:hypothetical protein
MTLHNIKITPHDHPKAIRHITKLIAINTSWMYILPNESTPRKLVRIGREWRCEIPCVSGRIETHTDEDFYTIMEDLRLSGAVIYNTH